MMRCLRHIALLLSLLSWACRPEYEEKRLISQIDSLNGALSVYTQVMSEQDSLFLNEALSRYETYRVFLKFRNEDTLSVEEARSIEHFFRNARQLESCRNNRPLLLQRCSVLVSQLLHLKHDIQQNTMPIGQAQEHLNRETKAVNELGQGIFQHERLRQQAVRAFSEHRLPVETYLRSKNEGKLPLTITATPAH